VPIYKNHEYEMIATCNNTSQNYADSMAVMYLYLGDTEFDKTDALRRMTHDLRPRKSSVSKATTQKMPRM
jgi:hypothetical protein